MNEYQGADSQQLPRLLVCVACGNPVRLGYFQPGPWSRLDSACVRVKRLPPKLRLSPTPNHERYSQPGPWSRLDSACVRVKRLPPKLRLSPTPNHERYFQPGPWSRLDSACVRVKRLPPKLRLSPTPNHERPHQGPGGYCTVKCPPPTAPVDEPFPRTILLPGAAPDGTVKVSAALPLMLPYKSASTAPR